MTKSAVNWFEISVSDMDKSAAFYGKVVGKDLRREVFFGVPNAVFACEDRAAVQGSLIADPKRPPRKGGSTVVYLHADDGVAKALARAADAGGKVLQPAMAIEPFGTIGVFEDLDGNVIGLHTPPG